MICRRYFISGRVQGVFYRASAQRYAQSLALSGWVRNRLGMVDWKQMVALARESLDELGVDIDPQAEVRSLEVAEQQLTEIARVLAERPKIVLLDEPTSALSDAERERLFETVRRMAAGGVGIVYISHHLAEVLVGAAIGIVAGRTFSDGSPLRFVLPRREPGIGLSLQF